MQNNFTKVMKIKIVFIALIVLTICGCKINGASKDAVYNGNLRNNKGLAYLREKKYKLAYNEFTHAIKIYYLPISKAIAYMNRGDVIVGMSEQEPDKAGYLQAALKDYRSGYRLLFVKTPKHNYYFKPGTWYRLKTALNERIRSLRY